MFQFTFDIEEMKCQNWKTRSIRKNNEENKIN